MAADIKILGSVYRVDMYTILKKRLANRLPEFKVKVMNPVADQDICGFDGENMICRVLVVWLG